MSALPLDERLEAHEPLEIRGRDRADVAMLVASRHDGSLVHARFGDLPEFLAPGDLVVVNTSATLPAAVDARLGDREVELRFSTPVPGLGGTHWVVELRTAQGQPFRRPTIPSNLALADGAWVELIAPYAGSDRLSVARLDLGTPLFDYLGAHGRPIRYSYVAREWPIEPLQPNYFGEVVERWRYADGAGELGVIMSVTQPFCGSCTRARLSAEGRLYLCLFASEGHDLRIHRHVKREEGARIAAGRAQQPGPDERGVVTRPDADEEDAVGPCQAVRRLSCGFPARGQEAAHLVGLAVHRAVHRGVGRRCGHGASLPYDHGLYSTCTTA